MKFYCNGCGKDFKYKKLLDHKCKKTLNERLKSLSVVFRCRKACSSAFAIKNQRNAHELWCSK